jgi:hypothetical protein
MLFVEVLKYVGGNGAQDSGRRCDHLRILRSASTAMDAQYNTDSAVNGVPEVRIIDQELH